MTEDTENKNSPLRLPADLRADLQREIGSRLMRGEKVTYGSLLSTAWEAYKSGGVSRTERSGEHRVKERYPARSLEAHDLLQLILDQDEKAAEWIMGNLRMFAEAIRSRSKPGGRRKAS